MTENLGSRQQTWQQEHLCAHMSKTQKQNRENKWGMADNSETSESALATYFLPQSPASHTYQLGTKYSNI